MSAETLCQQNDIFFSLLYLAANIVKINAFIVILYAQRDSVCSTTLYSIN